MNPADELNLISHIVLLIDSFKAILLGVLCNVQSTIIVLLRFTGVNANDKTKYHHFDDDTILFCEVAETSERAIYPS